MNKYLNRYLSTFPDVLVVVRFVEYNRLQFLVLNKIFTKLRTEDTFLRLGNILRTNFNEQSMFLMF